MWIGTGLDLNSVLATFDHNTKWRTDFSQNTIPFYVSVRALFWRLPGTIASNSCAPPAVRLATDEDPVHNKQGKPRTATSSSDEHYLQLAGYSVEPYSPLSEEMESTSQLESAKQAEHPAAAAAVGPKRTGIASQSRAHNTLAHVQSKGNRKQPVGEGVDAGAGTEIELDCSVDAHLPESASAAHCTIECAESTPHAVTGSGAALEASAWHSDTPDREVRASSGQQGDGGPENAVECQLSSALDQVEHSHAEAIPAVRFEAGAGPAAVGCDAASTSATLPVARPASLPDTQQRKLQVLHAWCVRFTSRFFSFSNWGQCTTFSNAV